MVCLVLAAGVVATVLNLILPPEVAEPTAEEDSDADGDESVDVEQMDQSHQNQEKDVSQTSEEGQDLPELK